MRAYSHLQPMRSQHTPQEVVTLLASIVPFLRVSIVLSSQRAYVCLSVASVECQVHGTHCLGYSSLLACFLLAATLQVHLPLLLVKHMGSYSRAIIAP